MTRPRGNQIWRRKSDGTEVGIWWRQTLRPHGDIVWSKVLFATRDKPGRIGFMHESDFVKDYEFVSGKKRY